MNTGEIGRESARADEDVRFEQACEWILRLREESVSPEAVTEWLVWSRASAANRQAFERAQEIWMMAGELDALPAVSESEHAGHAEGRGETGIAHLERRRPVRRLLALAAAAVLAAVTIGALPVIERLYLTPPSAEVLATNSGHTRVVRLSDGSTVTLSGGSRLLTAIDGRARTILLDRGQAYFEVAHDASRPFVVTAGELRVTAIGTAFDVRTGADRVVVSVADGVVAIDDAAETDAADVFGRRPTAARGERPARISIRAGAGQKASFDRSGAPELAMIDPAAAASWREGRLIFAREPLSAVADSISRQFGRKLVIVDPAVAELRYTGTVFQSHLQDWLQGLPTVFRVTVEERGDEVVIAPREGRL